MSRKTNNNSEIVSTEVENEVKNELPVDFVEDVKTENKISDDEKKLGENLKIKEGGEVMAISSNSRIGVSRYLQIHPQDGQIANLLKKKYAMKMYTISQWDKVVNDLRNKKTN